jgi:hypothetical protein
MNGRGRQDELTKSPKFSIRRAFLTGRHEIMKTGRKRSLIHLHFHVFILLCFHVEKG